MRKEKKYRRILCAVLCVLMTFSSFSYGYGETNEVGGQLAESNKSLNDWIAKGYVTSNHEGAFKPNASVTRAELAKVVNKTFELTALDKSIFKDVKKTDIAYKDLAIAKKSGYLFADKNGAISPKKAVSRQELASVIMNVMKLDKPKNLNKVNLLKDKKQISASYLYAVEAVIENGYMRTNSDGTFNPKTNITKAEALSILDLCLETVKLTYDKAGIYRAGVVTGSVTINSEGVTLENTIIKGNLIIGEGIGEGNLDLKNVTVCGDTIVYGGGMNSILVKDCSFYHIIILKKGNKVRVVASGNTFVHDVEMKSGGKLEENGLTGTGFGFVTLAEGMDAGATVSLVGNFENIEVQGNHIRLDLAGGRVETLGVLASAKDTDINLGKGSTISDLTMGAATSIVGEGTVSTANVNANGISINSQTIKIIVAPGIAAPSVPSGATENTGSVGGTVSDTRGSGGGKGGTGGTTTPTTVPTTVPTTAPTAAPTITPAVQLTISTPSLSTTKIYDGSNSATVTPGTLNGVLGTDKVTVSAVANYDSAAVGTGKTITVVYTLAGVDAGKYIKPVNYIENNGEIKSDLAGILTLSKVEAASVMSKTVLTLNETANTGNVFVFKVGDNEISGVSVKSTITDGFLFISGVTQATAKAGKYITIYEINSTSEKIVRYVSRKIEASEIQYFSSTLDSATGQRSIVDYDMDGGVDVVIPNSIAGAPVTSIGEGAFGGKNILSIVIPNGVISIGARAFQSNKLSEIVLPANINTIGDYAFSENQISYVSVPSSITSIGDYAFHNNAITCFTMKSAGCPMGENLLYGTSTTKDNGFRGAYSSAGIGTYTGSKVNPWGKTVLTVANVLINGFAGYEITPQDVTLSLEHDTFKSVITANTDISSWFTSLPIGLIAKVKSDVSADATSITITISGTPTSTKNARVLVSIPAISLKSNNSLATSDNKDAVIEIDTPAPAGVLTITKAERARLYHGTVLTISDTAEAGNSFYYTKGNTEVNGLTVADTGSTLNPFVSGVTGISVTANQYVTIYELNGAGKVVKYISRKIIPTEIQYMLFSGGGSTLRVEGCDISGGTDIDIPNVFGTYTIDTINNAAFINKGITSVVISEGITTIGDKAFEGNNLESIVIPNSLDVIGGSLFFNNKLRSVTIGSGVRTLGNSCFSQNELESIVIPNTVTGDIKAGAFWKNKLTSVTLGTGVKIIEGLAFKDNLLTSITIPSNVTQIQTLAFSENAITTVVMERSGVGVDPDAFDYETGGINFQTAYYAGGAGTYVLDAGSWKKQP